MARIALTARPGHDGCVERNFQGNCEAGAPSWGRSNRSSSPAETRRRAMRGKLVLIFSYRVLESKRRLTSTLRGGRRAQRSEHVGWGPPPEIAYAISTSPQGGGGTHFLIWSIEQTLSRRSLTSRAAIANPDLVRPVIGFRLAPRSLRTGPALRACVCTPWDPGLPFPSSLLPQL